MNITYYVIAYQNRKELNWLRYGNLEEMLNFVKEYEDEATEYMIITFVDGTEIAKDIITK